MLLNNKETTLLVDWDGNLQKTLDVWLRSTQNSLECRNVHLETSVIATHIMPHLKEAKKFGVRDEDIDVFIHSVLAQSLSLLPLSALDEDLWRVLETLDKNGVQQAIVSSSDKDSIQQALIHHHKEEHHFRRIITRNDVAKTKPDPEALLLAMSLLNTNPEHTYMLGDSLSDIEAGQRAKIKTIWYYPDHNQIYYEYAGGKKLNPTHIIRHPSELFDIVEIERKVG